jgi:hypothetical protein
MTNSEATAKNMAQTLRAIGRPAFEYFDREEVQREIQNLQQR